RMNIIAISSRSRRHHSSLSEDTRRNPRTSWYQSHVRAMSFVWSIGTSAVIRIPSSISELLRQGYLVLERLKGRFGCVYTATGRRGSLDTPRVHHPTSAAERHLALQPVDRTGTQAYKPGGLAYPSAPGELLAGSLHLVGFSTWATEIAADDARLAARPGRA